MHFSEYFVQLFHLFIILLLSSRISCTTTRKPENQQLSTFSFTPTSNSNSGNLENEPNFMNIFRPFKNCQFLFVTENKGPVPKSGSDVVEIKCRLISSPCCKVANMNKTVTVYLVNVSLNRFCLIIKQ